MSREMLVIEDEDGVQKYLRRVFGQEYSMTVVSNMDEGLSLLNAANTFDFVITDGMPNGIDVAVRCRKDRRPFIIHSGTNWEYFHAQCVDRDINPEEILPFFVQNPATLVELRARVQAAIDAVRR